MSGIPPRYMVTGAARRRRLWGWAITTVVVETALIAWRFLG
ncbi:hypothetical protein [Miltoncostaea marina]|nr:hypothetical protein [Miltoncostaea marina]